MMKIWPILIIAFLFIQKVSSQAYQWVTTSIGTLDELATSVKADHQNNVITAGGFQGGVDFDPGPGYYYLNAQASSDIFITKCTPDGQLIWAKNIGGNDLNLDPSLALDDIGNIYLTGLFEGKTDFDPGLDTFFLNALGSDVFVVKLDAHGNFVWAKSFGWTNLFTGDRGFAIEFGDLGNVYVGGVFTGKTDFDPGPGVFELDAPNGLDAFILKLTVDGDFVWAKAINGPGEIDVRGIQVDHVENIYSSGLFGKTADFDPDAGTYNITSVGFQDAFLAKFDSNGSLQWARSFGSKSYEDHRALTLDPQGRIYVEVEFYDTLYIEPSSGTNQLISESGTHIAIMQYDADGNLGWAKNIGSMGNIHCNDIHFEEDNIYHIGWLNGSNDMDPDTSEFILTPVNGVDAYVSSLDSLGRFRWAFLAGSDGYDLDIDSDGNMLVSGILQNTADFDPGPNTINHYANGKHSAYTAKYTEKGVTGFIYEDGNHNCGRDVTEKGLRERIVEIQPGDLIVQTSISGSWYIDSLPAGTYIANIDTSKNWKLTCTNAIEFTVVDPSGLTVTPGIGLKDISPCAEPQISVFGIGFRRCAPNQVINVRACNLISADKPLTNAYVHLTLDDAFTLSEMSLPYTSLGSNNFRIDIGTLVPGQCVQFHIKGMVDCNALLGQTICTEAYLFPVDSCALQPAETLESGLPSCAYQVELSEISIEGWCANDSIFFSVTNMGLPGDGDMMCFSKLRLFIDGVLVSTDSIQLEGGKGDTLIFSGDGRTWRLETDQHPLHPGLSMPSVTVELCGNSSNWTPGLGIILPQDDADPVVSLYCDVVRGPYDPNDKTGFPIGVGDVFEIAPDSKLEYRIRFQNTGNDTAFTVIVRDTLDEGFDIFSIQPGVSSHTYRFKVYGPRVLEWIFDNIQLPDSNVNYEASNGFVTFSINLKKGLPIGTQIFNHAAIYFDYNDPILTNYTTHTVSKLSNTPAWTEVRELELQGCKEILLNGMVYNHSGSYWQVITGESDLDSLLVLLLDITEPNLEVDQLNGMLLSNNTVAQYQWFNCEENIIIPGATYQNFTPIASGNYAVILNEAGCVDTSDCYYILLVNVNENFLLSEIGISPNPTNGGITIDLKTTYNSVFIDLYDANGRILQRNVYINQSLIPIEIPVYPGMYFLQVRIEDRMGIFKIIKR